MDKIIVSDLAPGSNSFSNTEPYMRELFDEKLSIQGGILPAVIIGVALYGPTLLGLGIAWAAGEL